MDVDGSRINMSFSAKGTVALYDAKRPVKSVASETQQELDRIKTENIKLRTRVRELEKKLNKIGDTSTADSNQ